MRTFMSMRALLSGVPRDLYWWTNGRSQMGFFLIRASLFRFCIDGVTGQLCFFLLSYFQSRCKWFYLTASCGGEVCTIPTAVSNHYWGHTLHWPTSILWRQTDSLIVNRCDEEKKNWTHFIPLRIRFTLWRSFCREEFCALSHPNKDQVFAV